MKTEIENVIDNFFLIVKTAVGTCIEPFRYELRKLGIKRCERWIYKQTEIQDGKDGIVQRYLKFMTALKKANFAGYEYLKFEVDFCLDGVEVVGVPKRQIEPMRILLDLEEYVSVSVLKVKKLLKGAKL